MKHSDCQVVCSGRWREESRQKCLSSLSNDLKNNKDRGLIKGNDDDDVDDNNNNNNNFVVNYSHEDVSRENGIASWFHILPPLNLILLILFLTVTCIILHKLSALHFTFNLSVSINLNSRLHLCHMYSFLSWLCKTLNRFKHDASDLDTPRVLCRNTWHVNVTWHINVTSLNINIIFVLRNLTLVTSLYSLFCGIKPVVSPHLSLPRYCQSGGILFYCFAFIIAALSLLAKIVLELLFCFCVDVTEHRWFVIIISKTIPANLLSLQFPSLHPILIITSCFCLRFSSCFCVTNVHFALVFIKKNSSFSFGKIYRIIKHTIVIRKRNELKIK
jgi:hypothetical protein